MQLARSRQQSNKGAPRWRTGSCAAASSALVDSTTAWKLALAGPVRENRSALWRILYDNTLLLLETGLQIVSMDLTVAFHSIVLTNTGRPDEQQNRHLTDWRTSSASRLSAIMSRICTHSWTCWTRACALMVAMVLMGGNAHAHASPLQSACSALSAATGQRLRCPATLLARQRPTPEAGAGAPGVPGPAPRPPARSAACSRACCPATPAPSSCAWACSAAAATRPASRWPRAAAACLSAAPQARLPGNAVPPACAAGCSHSQP